MRAVDVALQQYCNEQGALPGEERDDFLILEVARRLPDVLAGEVRNPVLDACLNSWSDDMRRDIVARSNQLKDRMIAALERTGDATEVVRSEEHTSELQSLMRISYAVFCLNKKKKRKL